MELEGIDLAIGETQRRPNGFGILNSIGDVSRVIAVTERSTKGFSREEAHATGGDVDFPIEDDWILSVKVDGEVIDPDADVIELEDRS